jgi:hypothetical protein
MIVNLPPQSKVLRPRLPVRARPFSPRLNFSIILPYFILLLAFFFLLAIPTSVAPLAVSQKHRCAALSSPPATLTTLTTSLRPPHLFLSPFLPRLLHPIGRPWRRIIEAISIRNTRSIRRLGLRSLPSRKVPVAPMTATRLQVPAQDTLPMVLHILTTRMDLRRCLCKRWGELRGRHRSCLCPARLGLLSLQLLTD